MPESPLKVAIVSEEPLPVGCRQKVMPFEGISVYMSHEDTDTTKGYIYNYNEIEKNRAYMDEAL